MTSRPRIIGSFDFVIGIPSLDLLYSHRIRCISDKELPHKGLEQLFRTGSKAGIQPKHAERLRIQLFALNNARQPTDMNAPGWRLHRLTGALANHWSVDVSGNWRMTFTFEGDDAILVDYQDYH